MIKKTFSRVLLVALALVMLFSFAGCSTGTLHASSNAGEVVATAGGLEIFYDEYYYLAMTRLQQLKLEYGEDAMSNPEARAKLESFVKENLLSESHALLAIGLSLGIDVGEGSIADSVEVHMEGILEDTFAGDRDAYIESLRKEYLTDRYIRTFVAVENYLSVEIIKELLQNGTLDDSDEAALTFLNGDDFTRVRQVVIKELVMGDKVILSMDKAKERAEALRATVAAATTDEARDAAMFEAVGESFDLTDTTGDGIYFARGEMQKDFEEAVFALPLYGVSEVFAVEGGYSFVMRLPKDAQYIRSNLEELKGKSYYVTLNRMVETWLAENPLEMTSFGESLDPAALETIDPDGGEGWAMWIPILLVGVAVIVAIFVIRVFVLRARLKRSKGKNAGK